MWVGDDLYIGWSIDLYEDSLCKLVIFSYGYGDTISVDRLYMVKESGMTFTPIHRQLIANYPKDRAIDEEFYNMYAEGGE